MVDEVDFRFVALYSALKGISCEGNARQCLLGPMDVIEGEPYVTSFYGQVWQADIYIHY